MCLSKLSFALICHIVASIPVLDPVLSAEKSQPSCQQRCRKVSAGFSFGYSVAESCIYLRGMHRKKNSSRLYPIICCSCPFSHKVVSFLRYPFFLMVLIHLSKSLPCGILAGNTAVTLTTGRVTLKQLHEFVWRHLDFKQQLLGSHCVPMVKWFNFD